MVIRKKNVAELNEQAFQKLIQDTDITALNPGSVARALVEAVNVNIEDLFNTLDLTISQTFLSQSTGFYLDLIGELFGLRRRNDVRAITYSDDQLIRFYVRDGALGDKIPHPTSPDLGRVPAGTTILNSDGTIAWTVVDNHDFPRAHEEVFVTAQAGSTGTSGNVGAGQLNQHSLGVTGVFVENRESIRSGIDVESDDAFRRRISQATVATSQANELAVRMAVLQVPGVADTYIEPNVAGAGSFRVLVIPEGNRLATNTITEVRLALRQTAAYGMLVLVEAPVFVPVSTIIKIETVAPNSEPLKQLVESRVRDYLANIRPGEELVINRIRQTVLSASTQIQDLEIIELCIDGKPSLIQNHLLARDELLVPDPSISDPIRII